MRIIAGEAGGRRLRCPPGQGTRPTSDRVREALFSMLEAPPATARVLDVFAGAGTLGLEALSRGAVEAVFIERDRTALRFLRQNIDSLGFADRAAVISGDSLRALKGGRLSGPFTWVFIDPPYASDLATRVLDVLDSSALIDADSTVIVEHDRRRPPPPMAGALEKSQSRRYGDTEVTLYRRGGQHE